MTDLCPIFSEPKEDSGTQNSPGLVGRLLQAFCLVNRVWTFIQRIKALYTPEKSESQCSSDKCPLSQHQSPKGSYCPSLLMFFHAAGEHSMLTRLRPGTTDSTAQGRNCDRDRRASATLLTNGSQLYHQQLSGTSSMRLSAPQLPPRANPTPVCSQSCQKTATVRSVS